MTNRPNRKSAAFTLIELMIVIAIIAILAAILVPNFIRARAQAHLTACESNLRQIATSLEMYSVDNRGHYPPTINLLTPNYLKTMPECPAAGSDTYTGMYDVTINPDTYSYYCEGPFHQGLGIAPNYPQWVSATGLDRRP